ncbi:hypothetical protein C8R43DRAFT_37539 [Mycena crocata]|nr:hypothetical protein C8R43DRAFT_37539 [Mycena crocata]
MPPTSSFSSFFPLVIDSTTYGIYSVLFFQSVHILLTRRRPHYKFHLACMIVLFVLSTIHIALAYAWAFITDGADTGIYELFSLLDPPPMLYGPSDPVSVRRIGLVLKVRYTLANMIADGILVHRCYVIWGFSWRAAAFPFFAYVCTFIGGIVGLLPLSGSSERAAVAVCVGTTFFTNILAAGLAAGRIWWISRRAAFFLGRNSRKKYMDLTAIILESGMIYPASLLITIVCFLSPTAPTASVLICIGAVYHIVAIAPTLIIVRVGLGVSTDDVDKCVTITNGHGTQSRAPTGAGGVEATSVLELRVRPGPSTTTDEFEESWNNTKAV